MQHSRSRPYRAESDAHDGTSGFGTVDYGPFATRRSQTRLSGCAGLAQTRCLRVSARSSSSAGGLVHDPPEFDSQRPAPSPPAPLPQTSLGERGARAKGLVSKGCSGLWVRWHAQSARDGRGTHRVAWVLGAVCHVLRKACHTSGPAEPVLPSKGRLITRTTNQRKRRHEA